MGRKTKQIRSVTLRKISNSVSSAELEMVEMYLAEELSAILKMSSRGSLEKTTVVNQHNEIDENDAPELLNHGQNKRLEKDQ